MSFCAGIVKLATTPIIPRVMGVSVNVNPLFLQLLSKLRFFKT